MGYYLQAFICKTTDSGYLTNTFSEAIKINIGQGISLIPMTESLYDQINNLNTSNDIDRFQYLTENVESEILLAVGNIKLAYVEAEYFGGQGGQVAIIWENCKRLQLLSYGDNRINQVLKYLGVISSKGQDEFLTLGFGLRRNTGDWIDGSD